MNKSLIKNAIFNILYKALNVIFPLVSTSYVSHVLLASGVGKVSYAQNIAQYFVLLAPLGLLNYGTKQVAGVHDNEGQKNKIFSELFIINFISTTICTLVYYVLIFSNPYFSGNRILFAVAGLAIVFNYINIEWFFQGTEEFAYIAVRSFIIKLISLVAMVLLVRSENDYIIYALVYVLAIGGNNFFNIIKLYKLNVKLSFNDITPIIHLKPVIILLLNTVAIELYTLFDTTMLGCLCSEETVAYYTGAVKLVKVWVSVITAISGVLLPRLSYYHKNGMDDKCTKILDNVSSILLYIIVPSIAGLVVLAEPVITVLYGNSFGPAAQTLKVASILIFAMGYSFLFGTQVLITFNQEKPLFICSLTGSVSNLALNLVLIPLYQQNGAIVASVICEIIVMLFTYIYAKKFVDIKLSWHDVFITSAGSIFMGILVYILSQVIESNYLKILFCIPAGIIIYVLFIFIFDKNSRNMILHIQDK